MAKHSPESGYPDGDPSCRGDPKGFYENLPFHGAPLKQVRERARGETKASALSPALLSPPAFTQSINVWRVCQSLCANQVKTRGLKTDHVNTLYLVPFDTLLFLLFLFLFLCLFYFLFG